MESVAIVGEIEEYGQAFEESPIEALANELLHMIVENVSFDSVFIARYTCIM